MHNPSQASVSKPTANARPQICGIETLPQETVGCKISKMASYAEKMRQLLFETRHYHTFRLA
jgi:hypothetical protein